MSIHNSNTKFIARMTKATLLTLSLCLAAQCLFAQINYVRSWTITAPDLDPNAVITRPVNEARPTSNYLDGLGRPVQTVVKQGSLVTASALTGDLVSLKGFDDVARPSKQYLPYAAATIDGTYKSDALTAQPAFYNGTNSPVAGQVENGVYAYAQTNLEYSPLDRTLLTMPPGNGWLGSNKGVRTLYCGNTGVDSVPIWQVVDNGLGNFATYTTTNFYPTGSLYKTITTDENGQQVIEYKDNEGKTLLKKTELTATDNGNGSGYSGSLSTCYIYDNLNNLRCVIQPSGVAVLAGNGWVLSSNSTLLAEQCFRYEYDQRNRLIMKQVPGAGPVFMVYDVVDRLVMTQDANLRSQLKWMATLYDALNRPVITGLLSDNSSWSQLQSAVTTLTATTSVTNYTVAGQSISTVQVANNPIASSGSLDILTVTYYDNYNWTTPAGVSGSYAAPPSSGFVTSYNTAPQYAQQMTASSQTAGLVTGTLTRVLGTTNQYLSSVSFYDDYHRVIQARQTNYTGSADVLSTQYDFSGKPLRNLLQHQKGGNGPQSHTVMTKFDYDAMYREINCWKNIDGASSDQLISSMQYDALGQLSMKQLGKDLVSGSSLDNLSYTYNIRGWLAYINKDYVSQTGPGTNYFGLELGYEKATSASGSNYLNPTYNGNIAGMVWKSAGDQIERKYDFTYDNVSRLTGAAYLDNQSGWGKSVMDFTVDSLGYDANGNILSMYQHGFKLGSPTGLIDQLTYTYQPNSNKLAQVADGVNDPNSTLGDFHYSGTKQSADYSYDGNGNLTLDNNKKIDYIVYNYLNLPQQVHINGKGNILYTYDATGNKLQKQVIDSAAGIATTTLYLGGFQYQRRTPMATPSGGTDTLQFMGHEEGRARWAFHKYTTGDSAYGWEYDFMEKDHLGNTRVLLTQERDTANYIATMEDQYRTTEDALFYGIDNCVTSNPGWFPVQPGTPNPNNSIANTDGYSTHIGPSILLKVMSGDNLNIGVNALAFDGVVQPPHSSFQYVLNTLATGLVSQTGAAHGDFTSLTDPSSALYAAVGSFLSSKDTNTTSTPKAYLNWMLLDNRLNYVSGNGQSGAIPLTGLNTMQTLGQTIPISSSGYLYIWVSNESPLWNVFWDNLSVRHISGPMLEENHYYPFGLTMAAISDKAIKSNYAENKYRFNKGSELQNKEFSDGSGLEMYETQLRELDPQLGRWWQLDPKPDSSRSLYAAMGNNPILHNDPHGDTLVFPKADPKFIQTVQHTILGMVNNGVGQNIANLAASNSKVNVVEIGDKDKIGSRYSPKRNTIYWNPNQGIVTTNGTKLSPATLLEHEADHATDNINHPADNANRGLVFAMNYHNAEEARVIQGSEQRTALGMGEIKPGQVTRTDHYASFLIHTEDPLSTTGPLRPIP